MFRAALFLLAILSLSLTAKAGTSQSQTTKYRICIADSDHKSRTALKYCPLLNTEESKAECVFGNSRLDCLRLISGDKADFGTFEAEELVVASNYKSSDFSITHDIQYYEKKMFEYEVVAVVRKSSNITNLSQLRGKNLCHPGYGYDLDWTEVIAKFFESRVVPQECDPALSLEENAIKSSSIFFKAACKAGPWVLDTKYDRELKTKYPNLCQLCDTPYSCSTLDKYWGRTGPLYCLTDGFGDVTWSRLDDINQHFGFAPGIPPVAPPEDYNFLCNDGSLAPLNKPGHCSWVARPWPAIVARRKSAEGVQMMISSLKEDASSSNWKVGLQQILDSVRLYVFPLDTIMVPEDYLARAPGFLSANSMMHCGSQRVMRLCTRTNAEYTKCNWLKEAAQAFGVEPKLFCVRDSSTENCLRAVQSNIADVVTVETEWLTTARRKYGLKSLLYEFSSNPTNSLNIAAVVKTSSPVKSMADLKGKKACFPSYEGVGWNTLIDTLRNMSLLPATCPYENAVGQFFSKACVPGLNTSHSSYENLKSLCKGDTYSGESGAFKCLATGKGDVAFTALSTILNNTDGANNESWAASLKYENYRPLCVDNSTKLCYLSWATQGQVMVKSSLTIMRAHEIYIAFKEMSALFGTTHKNRIPTIQLFGGFDGKKNVMFHDTTERFEDFESLPYISRRPRNYEHMVARMKKCSTGSSTISRTVSWLTTVAVILCMALV